jgi:succinyl-diaminopimelate desuccinylase
MDPVALAQALIRCPSVTPEDAGVLGVLADALEPMGFACRRLTFSEEDFDDVDNLYARLGDGGPNFCFAGHTDVVPPGDLEAWSVPPFEGRIVDGRLMGRGAADMKSGVACFVAAVERFVAARGNGFGGSISLLVTNDEEGPFINGTVKVLEWLREEGEALDACIVGEPSNPTTLGEMVKIGRRGSLNGSLVVHGTQGHSAYPEKADNPIPRLIAMLTALSGTPLDEGTEHFQPSHLAITSVDVGNPVSNVIPARAEAAFNVRFNDLHTGTSLEQRFRQQCAAVGGRFDLHIDVSGEAFLTPPGPLSDVIVGAVERVLGRRPVLDTGGGTSDARFIKDHCPVAEFGLTADGAHKVDESVAVADLPVLVDIYHAVLDGFFAREV